MNRRLNRHSSRGSPSGPNSRVKYPLSALLLLVPVSLPAEVIIGDFSGQGLNGWQSKSFQGETDYQLVDIDDGKALKAESRAAASGLYHEQTIDLTETPCLHWRWKIANILQGIDETTRAGDDYPARVYVVFSGGLAFWRTRTIVYVWASTQPQGSRWHSAFTDNARVIAVESGEARAGEWISESRNVRQDYKQLFGEDISQADAVAIMTDTDNSGQTATAWYADITFRQLISHQPRKAQNPSSRPAAKICLT